MSVDATAFVWSLTNLKGGEKLVLLCCADIANSEGRNIYPSVATIARRCGMSERAVQVNLAELRNLKLLAYDTPTNLSDDQRRKLRTNVYRIVGMPEERDREWREVDRGSGGFRLVRNLPIPSEGADSAPVQNLHPEESAPLTPQNLHPDPAESALKPLTTHPLNRKGVNPLTPEDGASDQQMEPWELDRLENARGAVEQGYAAASSPADFGPVDVQPASEFPSEFESLWFAYPKRSGESKAATFVRWKRTVSWPADSDHPKRAAQLDRAREVAGRILAAVPLYAATEKWERGYQPELSTFLAKGTWKSPPADVDGSRAVQPASQWSATQRANRSRPPVAGHATAAARQGAPPASRGVSRLESSPFTVSECGVSSVQVWQAILTELATSGRIPAADLNGIIRPAELIGRGLDGQLIVGTLSATAQRRASRYVSELQRAAAVIVGAVVPIKIVERGPWLTANPDQGIPTQERHIPSERTPHPPAG